jgi:cell division protein FtsB
MTCEDLQCDKVVKLFEDIWAIESIRNQRKKFILSHWLYFHIQWVRRTQETGADLIPFISDVLDKKEEADKTIEEIAQKVNFNH